MSLIKTANKVSPRTDPCGIPLITFVHGDDSPSITTLCFLLDKKGFNPYRIWLGYAILFMAFLQTKLIVSSPKRRRTHFYLGVSCQPT